MPEPPLGALLGEGAEYVDDVVGVHVEVGVQEVVGIQEVVGSGVHDVVGGTYVDEGSQVAEEVSEAASVLLLLDQTLLLEGRVLQRLLSERFFVVRLAIASCAAWRPWWWFGTERALTDAGA